MSLTPSTDLVLEVSRAADPSRAAAVTERLNALSGASASSGDGFQAALGAAVGASAPAPVAPRPNTPISPGRKAQQMLEGAFLTQFVQEMLPKDTPSAFGQGYAGDMWRSMLAERVADQMAASGRLGIASKLFAGRTLTGHADMLSASKLHGADQADVTLTSANSLALPATAAVEKGAALFGSPAVP